MKRYMEMSARVMEIFRTFTPSVRQISIDEASLDMTGTERLWGEVLPAGRRVKEAVLERTGLTVSLGAGSNRYVAKIASGLEKPDGFFIVESGRESEFMKTLPLDRLWGAGEKTRKELREIGVTDIAGLQAISHNVLEWKFGKSGTSFLLAASAGENPGIFAPESKSRSMSGERTFEFDTADAEAIDDVLRLLADELAARLHEDGEFSCTLALKLRYSDFSSLTRQCTKPESYRSSDEILDDARRLLDQNWDGRVPVRLVGLGLHGLGKGRALQAPLFGEELGASEKARRAVEEIERVGKGRLVRARFLKDGGNSRPR